jgi:hypothetical protein
MRMTTTILKGTTMMGRGKVGATVRSRQLSAGKERTIPILS